MTRTYEQNYDSMHMEAWIEAHESCTLMATSHKYNRAILGKGLCFLAEQTTHASLACECYPCALPMLSVCPTSAMLKRPEIRSRRNLVQNGISQFGAHAQRSFETTIVPLVTLRAAIKILFHSSPELWKILLVVVQVQS